MAQQFANAIEVFAYHCVDITFDKKLYAAVCHLQEGFVSRSSDHIAFFGGNLTGVQRIRFIDSDRDKLFDLVLRADEYEIRKDVFALRDRSGKVAYNKDWKVSSDIFNIACIYLMHGFATSPHLTEEQREDAKLRVGIYLMYKFLTSLYAHRFKFGADPAVARATYDALTMKYLLKQCGSWGKMIERLVESLIGKEGLHYAFLLDAGDDGKLVKMLNDLQGRIRDIVNNLVTVHYQMHNDKTKVGEAAIFQEFEGEISLRDRTDSLEKYGKYLKRVVSDPNGFVRDELVSVVTRLVHTLAPRTLYQTLTWTSNSYHGERTKEIDVCIDLVMEHAIDYLSGNRAVVLRDAADVLTQLRGTYMSPRSTDVRLIRVRSEVEKLMAAATGSTNQNTLASARTAWMLYVVVRALSVNRYNN